jgi:hypothetical protein
VWELREAARLGCAVPVLDPTGFGPVLARRAEAMTPLRERVESTLRDVYLSLVAIGGGTGEPARHADALRGCLDNLALLALLERPRRYQKPKWVLADLLHAGEEGLVDAILAAYGILGDDASPAGVAVAGAGAVVSATFAAAGLLPHEVILEMGHAPKFAEASYVSRCLEDAADLGASGRFVEAQYVAKFAARLAAGLLGGAAATGVIDAFPPAIAERYLALFGSVEIDHVTVDATLAAADARRRVLERPA